jgi:hypothetical protein
VISTAKRKVADEEELARILSAIARGEVGGETVKVSERLKAAELLGKRYDMFGKAECAGGDVRVVVDYVGRGENQV